MELEGSLLHIQQTTTSYVYQNCNTVLRKENIINLFQKNCTCNNGRTGQKVQRPYMTYTMHTVVIQAFFQQLYFPVFPFFCWIKIIQRHQVVTQTIQVLLADNDVDLCPTDNAIKYHIGLKIILIHRIETSLKTPGIPQKTSPSLV